MNNPQNKTLGRPAKYPFASLINIGDSFLVENPSKSLRSSAYSFGRRHNMKITVKVEKGDEVAVGSGLRVSRLA